MKKIIGKVEQVGLKLELQIRKNRLFIIAPPIFLKAMKGLYEKQSKASDSRITNVAIIDDVLVIEYRWRDDKPMPETEEEIKECEEELYNYLKEAMQAQGIKIEHF